MDRMKINILGIAETRWQGTNSIKHKGKFMIYSGGDKHERGVGIIFDETAPKSLKSWIPVPDRIIVAKIKAKPFDIGMIQVYAPTSERPEEEVEEFYEDLDRRRRSVVGGSYVPKLAELGVLCMPASFVTYQRPQGLMQDCLRHWAESQYWCQKWDHLLRPHHKKYRPVICRD